MGTLVKKLDLRTANQESGDGPQDSNACCFRCFSWLTFSFRYWALTLLFLPLLIITILNFVLIQGYTVQTDIAWLFTRQASAWFLAEVNHSLALPRGILDFATDFPFDPDLCQNAELPVGDKAFFAMMSRLGPSQLTVTTDAKAMMVLTLEGGEFHISIQRANGISSACSFQASQRGQIRIKSEPFISPSPSLQPTQQVNGPTQCIAGSSQVTCQKQGVTNGATLAFPITYILDKMSPEIWDSPVSLTLLDWTGTLALASSCSTGLQYPALTKCIPDQIPTVPGDLLLGKYAVTTSQFSGLLQATLIVSVSLQHFTSDDKHHLGPAAVALAMMLVFTFLGFLFSEFLVVRPMEELRMGLDELHAVLTIDLNGRGFLKMPRFVQEMVDVTLAYNRALKRIMAFKSYIPAVATPRSTGSIFRSTSAETSPIAFGSPRGRGFAKKGHATSRGPQRKSDGSGDENSHLRDLEEMAEAGPRTMPQSNDPEVDEDGQQIGPPPIISLDGVQNEISRRLGTVLVVELWYQDKPFTHLNIELHAQHSISEAFIQLVMDSIQKARGTIVQFDASRVVATWNAFAPQTSHEYWACNAALFIQQKFSNAMQPFIRPMAECSLTKSDLFVFMAVVRGSMNVGYVGGTNRRIPVVYGDTLLMAERLTTLNSYCNTFILMPQRTFEAVQGFFTAEIVDYVSSFKKNETVAVYQLLGSEIEDSLTYIDHYKDAFFNFTRHRFDEALDKLAVCQDMVHDDKEKWAPLRRLQCARLQELITSGRNRSLPNPYYRKYLDGWEAFEVPPGSPLRGTPASPLHVHGDVVAAMGESNSFDIRAGLTTVTADMLTGILSKEATQRADHAGWSQQVKELKTQSVVVQGLKRSIVRKASDIKSKQAEEDLPDVNMNAFPMHMLTRNWSDSSALEQPQPSPSPPPQDDATDSVQKSCIEGQSFRDISGRNWRCSAQYLGHGAFGTVYLGIDEQGKLVAVKEVVLKYDSETILNQLTLNEIVMLWNLQHTNIVSYQGCAVVRNSLVIIMEYIACGTLESIIHTFGHIHEGTAVHYTRDIVRGLAFLHANHVVHLDVKPANVLLDQQGTCKLADFGTASALSNLMQSEVMGTPAYMAPERVKNETTALSDIWSLGITLAEVLTGKKPFAKECTAESMLYGLYTGTMLPIIPTNLSMHAISFLKQCLAWEPLGRSTATDLLHHPFLL